MTTDKLPTKEYLCNALSYRDGFLYWQWRDDIPLPVNKRFAHKRAGSVDSKGYIVVRIQLQIFKAHRIVWMMHNGVIPDEMQVDHIDGDKANNKIENLRLATSSQNRFNVTKRADNTTGFKGVCHDKRRNKWSAEIRAKGKRYKLGRFASPELAHAAYCEAAKRLHGDFVRLK
jgi:hypothetical protein